MKGALYESCEKKGWYLDYLLIIVGTGLMALAINSVLMQPGW